MAEMILLFALLNIAMCLYLTAHWHNNLIRWFFSITVAGTSRTVLTFLAVKLGADLSPDLVSPSYVDYVSSTSFVPYIAPVLSVLSCLVIFLVATHMNTKRVIRVSS